MIYYNVGNQNTKWNNREKTARKLQHTNLIYLLIWLVDQKLNFSNNTLYAGTVSSPDDHLTLRLEHQSPVLWIT